MILPAVLFAALAAPTPIPGTPGQSESERLLAEAGHALRQGRLDQASTMVTLAVQAGADGSALTRVQADIAHVRREDARALPLYRQLLVQAPDDPALLERGGISALRLGQVDEAHSMLVRAHALTPGRWPILNALAVLSDRRRDFASANRFYALALAEAPESPTLLSNHGWSMLLQGRWAEAVAPLERALALDPRTPKAEANLELARAAMAGSLPRRRHGESGEDFAGRLNDAGVAAAAQGNFGRARAAFTQALEMSDQWYDRAAQNLESLEGRK